MRQEFSTFLMIFLLVGCNQNSTTKIENKTTDATDFGNLLNEPVFDKKLQVTKNLSFKYISEIVADSSYSTWVNIQNSSPSLALHFQYKDTLAVSYSSECWLMYPYKLEGNRIVVFWDNNIDTKYNFDIVKAINKINKKKIGQPFMILELENDTTLHATYPQKELIRKINSSSRERIFFPDKYMITQDRIL